MSQICFESRFQKTFLYTLNNDLHFAVLLIITHTTAVHPSHHTLFYFTSVCFIYPQVDRRDDLFCFTATPFYVLQHRLSDLRAVRVYCESAKGPPSPMTPPGPPTGGAKSGRTQVGTMGGMANTTGHESPPTRISAMAVTGDGRNVLIGLSTGGLASCRIDFLS